MRNVALSFLNNQLIACVTSYSSITAVRRHIDVHDVQSSRYSIPDRQKPEVKTYARLVVKNLIPNPVMY